MTYSDPSPIEIFDASYNAIIESDIIVECWDMAGIISGYDYFGA